MARWPRPSPISMFLGMIMMACWRTGLRGWRQQMVAMAAILALAACQQGPSPDLLQREPPWRVVETSGDVRIEHRGLLYATSLRPGDEFVSESRIFVEKSGHLIMSRNDLQFTANGHALISLPTSGAQTALSHDYGKIRVRLAAAANAAKRLATPHLVASGTNAVLDLHVDDLGTDITVISGTVTLSTSNGRHYAKLVDGASARLGDKTDGQLEIQPAAEKPFQPSPDLDATATDDEAPAPKIATKPHTTMRKASNPDRRSKETVKFAVLPAARLKTVAQQPAESTESGIGRTAESALLPAGSTGPAPVESKPLPRRTPLQQQFDQLTEDLLDGLHSSTTKSDPYR